LQNFLSGSTTQVFTAVEFIGAITQHIFLFPVFGVSGAINFGQAKINRIF
jgi:hypothetical protein